MKCRILKTRNGAFYIAQVLEVDKNRNLKWKQIYRRYRTFYDGVESKCTECMFKTEFDAMRALKCYVADHQQQEDVVVREFEL